ncbi:hypothetical protein Cgig2_013021 [Carnegiea gigantea]|uniref:Uncharacterized protein n=1 Tax=Carnegiea gigantea TaxID=171969 RepID=A0A9Q1GQ36_9CARY|nr:hypothetical protein Cgig2_013021 [Carnegiea gigantea]
MDGMAVRPSTGDSCEWVGTTHGGCPDLDACARKCLNCFTGTGQIISGCFSKGIDEPNDECRCYFGNGAPCEKDCLRGAATNSGGGSALRTFNNGTQCFCLAVGPAVVIQSSIKVMCPPVVIQSSIKLSRRSRRKKERSKISHSLSGLTDSAPLEGEEGLGVGTAAGFTLSFEQG